MFYKRVKIKLSERSLMRIVFGVDFPEIRQVNCGTEMLDSTLERLKRVNITDHKDFKKEIVAQFNNSPIYGLRVGEVLKLNNYRIVVDSNDNILLYIDNAEDKSVSRTVQEVIFIYESEDFFNGSKMMRNILDRINDINEDLEKLYASIPQESKPLLKKILKDEYKLDNLMKRNKV